MNFLGICDGDKIPSQDDETVCVCPDGSIQGNEDRCIVCSDGEITNEDQTKCVGKSNQTL